MCKVHTSSYSTRKHETAMATCANSGFHNWIASSYLKIISSQIFFPTHPGQAWLAKKNNLFEMI
jgi:hypothetical protein